MGKLTIANLRKTLYYLRRNGLRNTWNAARERLAATEVYAPMFLSEAELGAMRQEVATWMEEAEAGRRELPFFYILVPAYRTNPVFLKELVESVQAQVYPKWELLILDASEDSSVLNALLETCSETKMALQWQDKEEKREDLQWQDEEKKQEDPKQQDEEEKPEVLWRRDKGEKQEVLWQQDKEEKQEGLPQQGKDAMDERESLAGVVRYVKLPSNAGISGNTNAGLSYISGGYVGLLDHDDVLTPDALYEMAKAICEASGDCARAIYHPPKVDGRISYDVSEEGIEAVCEEFGESAKIVHEVAWNKLREPLVLYSDEDKWDGAEQYYEPNRKEDFNLDLLLSNNYICHFLVMKTELFQELKLRKEYDGAQDYDLVLRATAWIMGHGGVPELEVCHIPKVLYHWRCHGGSTAENPQSKLYAYEAGRRALQDFADRQGWQAKAQDLKHVGFYRLTYESEGTRVEAACPTLENRSDLGAMGGKILANNMLVGGRMAEDGGIFYEGLKAEFSGYLHRGVLTQDAEAVDLRCICVAKEFWHLFEEVVGVPYVTHRLVIQDGKAIRKDEAPLKQPQEGGADQESITINIFDARTLPTDADIKKLSLSFCKALREQGKRILWDPELILHV